MMQIDLQCSFLVGSTMAFLAKPRLHRAPAAWRAKARTAVLVVGGLVFAPVWLYITLRWTAWETMYTWDLANVPTLLVAAFLPAISALAMAGFWATSHLIASKRMPAAIMLNAAIAAACLAITAIGWDKVTYVGNVAGFQSGARHNFMGSDLMKMFIIATVLDFAPCALIVAHWLREKD